MRQKQTWYIRRNGQIKGPFPGGQISQYLVLGRVQATDEVSLDKENWRMIRTVPELVPDVLRADPEDEMAGERLRAARRWADERRPDEGESWGGSNRREQLGDHNRLTGGNADKQGRPGLKFVQLMAVLGVVLLGLYLAIELPSSSVVSVAECDAPAKPGVNWSYCRMSGVQLLKVDLTGAMLNSVILNGARVTGSNLSEADLSYADLSNARLSFVNLSKASLKGANLRYADLRNADLTRVDLSYADLSQAMIQEAGFDMARFDHAIWVDGSKCAPGSIGKCRPEK